MSNENTQENQAARSAVRHYAQREGGRIVCAENAEGIRGVKFSGTAIEAPLVRSLRGGGAFNWVPRDYEDHLKRTRRLVEIDPPKGPMRFSGLIDIEVSPEVVDEFGDTTIKFLTPELKLTSQQARAFIELLGLGESPDPALGEGLAERWQKPSVEVPATPSPDGGVIDRSGEK
jgi:hypothetical protein